MVCAKWSTTFFVAFIKSLGSSTSNYLIGGWFCFIQSQELHIFWFSSSLSRPSCLTAWSNRAFQRGLLDIRYSCKAQFCLTRKDDLLGLHGSAYCENWSTRITLKSKRGSLLHLDAGSGVRLAGKLDTSNACWQNVSRFCIYRSISSVFHSLVSASDAIHNLTYVVHDCIQALGSTWFVSGTYNNIFFSLTPGVMDIEVLIYSPL